MSVVCGGHTSLNSDGQNLVADTAVVAIGRTELYTAEPHQTRYFATLSNGIKALYRPCTAWGVHRRLRHIGGARRAMSARKHKPKKATVWSDGREKSAALSTECVDDNPTKGNCRERSCRATARQ